MLLLQINRNRLVDLQHLRAMHRLRMVGAHSMNGCCTATRHDDGTIDSIAIERAIMGQTTALTRRERTLTVWRLSVRRGWGLDRISQHMGYSRTKIAEILAQGRGGS